MTIDERLERLTERHEVLTQSVELLVAENRHTAEGLRHTAEGLREMGVQATILAAENKQRDKRMGEIMEGIARLLHVAEIHQALDDHEDRLKH
jgi:hypothetical protein